MAYDGCTVAAVAALAAGVAVWAGLPAPPLARLVPTAADRAARAAARRLAAWGDGWRARVAASVRGRGGRKDAAVRASVPQVCELLAVCLDAGRPPRTALRVVRGVLSGPVVEELDAVAQRIDLGVDEAQAWAGLGSAPGYAAVARDLARSVHSGVGLSALLRQHARDARRDGESSAQVAARAAGVKAVVPLVVCFLPAFLLVGVVPLFGALASRLG